MKRYFLPLLVTGFLNLSACSCSNDAVIQQILGTSVEAPVFIDCRPVSSEEIVFKFSVPVKVVSLNFDPPVETDLVGEGQEVSICLSRPLEAGAKFTADILVEDSGRNTLNVIVPFRARNDSLPDLLFNELRFDSSTNKVEFVEFYTRTPGNLGALRLFIAHQSLSIPVYEFPPVEVKAGEYIVLHLRTVEEGCVDETGTNLGLSRGVDAQNTARDFWIPGSKKLLHKTNGLWILDQDDHIMDAVLLSENPETDGTNKTFIAASEFLGRQKAWLPSAGNISSEGWLPDTSSAIYTKGTTNTRTLCRDETLPPERRSGNWYIAATSSATPGMPNSTKKYTQ